MSVTPSVIVFDVNETLSDLVPLRRRFAEIGAPEDLAPLWFTSVLRDGFALTVTGGQQRFAEIGAAALHTMLHGVDLDRPLDDAVDHVLSGFLGLPVHPDVPDGIRALREAGLRLVTLSNGATAVAEKLLGDHGLREHLEHVLSVEDAGAWKPARRAYEYAARVCGTEPGELMMVAIHPWDLHGAAEAGFMTAWINRNGVPYPPFFHPPTVTATGLVDLAAQLS